MMFLGHHSMWKQHRLHVLYSLISALTCSIENAESCTKVTKSLGYEPGSPQGADCTYVTGPAGVCSIKCAANEKCRLVYNMPCDVSVEPCQCAYCDQVTTVQFGTPAGNFYLFTQQLVENTATFQLPGGLVIGQPLFFAVKPLVDQISLNFLDASFNNALELKINFPRKYVATKAKIDGVSIGDNSYTPQFNFSRDRIINIFITVTSTKYVIYLDQVVFRNFEHRMNPAQIKKMFTI